MKKQPLSPLISLSLYSLSLFPYIYQLPKRSIKRYKRKCLGWLQGEIRKLHKIFEDKNLTESVQRFRITCEIWHGVRNFAQPQVVSQVCEISHSLKWFRRCARFRIASSGFVGVRDFTQPCEIACLLDFFFWLSSLHLWLAW